MPHTLAMEGRLRDPPLPPPETAAARQHAVAQHDPDNVEGGRVLVVVVDLIEQNVADEGGIRDEVAAGEADSQGNHPAASGPPDELTARIAGQRDQVAGNWPHQHFNEL